MNYKVWRPIKFKEPQVVIETLTLMMAIVALETTPMGWITDMAGNGIPQSRIDREKKYYSFK